MRSEFKQQQAGFSLIEVLLALFIIALVIGTATEVAGNAVRNVTLMKEVTFARWVALNQIELYKIELAQDQVARAPGISEGEAEMGNMQWRWVREITGSSSADLLEIRSSVYRADDDFDADPVIVMKGYVAAI